MTRSCPTPDKRLVSAVLWFWFGIRKGDKNIYLACVGWITLDVAVIVGAIIYG